jgi:hypothetical protein
MTEVLKFLDSADKVLLVFGALLISLGVLAPRNILGVELLWKLPKIIAAVFFGLVFVLLSMPQARVIGTQSAPLISVASIDSIKRLVTEGRMYAYGASTNTSDVRGCVSASARSYTLLDEALRQIDAVRDVVAPRPAS